MIFGNENSRPTFSIKFIRYKQMPSINKSLIILISMLMTSTSALAARIAPVSVIGSGGYTNSTSLLTDGVIPMEGTGWASGYNVFWTGTFTSFTLDFGEIYTLSDVLISVDYNDNYRATTSTDGLSYHYSTLFNINASHGESVWGMDTMSSDNTNAEYVAGIHFLPVQARYLKVFATGGDNFYSMGEIQAFGTPLQVVPIPSIGWLFGTILLLKKVLSKASILAFRVPNE